MARTATQAFEEYARPLQAALVCVAPVHIRRGHVAVNSPMLFTPPGFVMRLKRSNGRAPLYFSPIQQFRIVHDRRTQRGGPYGIEVDSTSYQLLTNDRREILAYHWNPQGTPPDPHLHIGSVLLDTNSHDLAKGFSKRHIATGYVPLQRIVRMLIEEFDVEPLRGDWAEVLSALDASRS